MDKILSPSAMQNIDRRAIHESGIPGMLLMENAGNAVLNEILYHYPEAKSITLVCGKGNNGGDGFVIARRLINYSNDINIFCTFDKNFKSKGDAGLNLKLIQSIGLNIKYLDQMHMLPECLERSNIIIDAIFGTGLNSPLREPYSSIIDMMNASNRPIVSVDIPSGIDGNSGQILGNAVKAQMTITFAHYKKGHFLYPGKKYSGKIIKRDIGIPYYLSKDEDFVYLIEREDIRKKLKPREVDSHKGDHGHLCIIGGSKGKAGAVIMSGMASLKTGAGLLTLAVRESIGDIVNANFYEAMVLHLKENEEGIVKGTEADRFIKESDKYDALVLGPGMGITDYAREFLFYLLKNINIPVLLDADALNIISRYSDEFSFIKDKKIIFTPHIGELARFFENDKEKVQKDIIKYAKILSKRFNACVIAKGATNFIIEPSGRVFCIQGGGPQLAKGGSGDVLTGIIGALLANGYNLLDSSLIGVYLHKLSSELTSSRINNRSLIARELIECISNGYDNIEKY